LSPLHVVAGWKALEPPRSRRDRQGIAKGSSRHFLKILSIAASRK
jgi:hypothetical protein